VQVRVLLTTNHEIIMNNEALRESVSKAYAEALRKSKQGSGGCCGEPRAPAGVAAKLADYGAALAAHEDAAVSSFGCGNPLAFADVAPGETVLDLGSGAGFDLLIAAERVGPDGLVIGVDMTDEMLDAARENVAKAGVTNVELRKGLIEELPVETGSVDWVISNCVINLSPEKDRVFAEIARVLAPGGRFSISDIVAESLPSAIRDHPAAYAACIAGAISEADYVAGLRAAGLDEIEVDERLVYTADQLRGLVASDLANLDLDPESLAAASTEIEGNIWSARIRGRRPR
jgi:arsenite methyltransferase